MKKITHIIFVTLFIFPGFVFSLDNEMQLEKYMQNLQTMEASFEQSVHSDKGGLIDISQGKFYLSRPGKFRWDYAKPYEQSIVSNGDKIWIYDTDLEQVTIRSANEALANSPALLLSNDVSLEKEFSVTKLEPIKNKEWFQLTPKNDDSQYIEIRLAFEESSLKLMELKDSFGQLTRIFFSDEKLNQTIDAATFDFIPPQGVDVLDNSASE